METVKDKKGNTIAIKIEWGIDDVMATANQMTPKARLSRKKAGLILDAVLHDHDATMGINWDVIEFQIGNFI